MRKFILLSAMALVLSLTACGDAPEKGGNGSRTEGQVDGESSGEDEDLVISEDTEDLEPEEEQKMIKVDETDETWFTEEGDADFINE